MGQVPNRHPIYMSEISAALGGTNDLGWYRGRTYYRDGAPVVISASPSMAEFPGLTNVAPFPWQVVGTVWANVDIEIRIAYRPRTGEMWMTYQAIGNDYPISFTANATFNPALYAAIQTGAAWAAGDGGVGVTLTKGLTPGSADDYMELSMTHAQSGSQQAAAYFYAGAQP